MGINKVFLFYKKQEPNYCNFADATFYREMSTESYLGMEYRSFDLSHAL